VAAALASLPYATAFILWCVATLALYATTIAKIARARNAWMVACAAPAVLAALISGQNGLLTASLVGLSLLFLEKRPALAGLILGLLSYKPQFGILFPLALAAGGYWRSFLWAGVSVVASNGLAAAIFGTGTLGAFLHAMTITNDLRIAHAGMGWNKLESLYGFLRATGFPGTAAWAMQALASVSIAIGVVLGWRAPLPYGLKAALLAAAIPLATPYILAYDLPVLAISAAFLYRERAFDKVELALLTSTVPSVLGLLWLPMPSAFFASLAVGAIALRRCYAPSSRSRISPSWVTEATSLPSSE
jgi:arabinofuranan 3-O-arabinosyltransferase